MKMRMAILAVLASLGVAANAEDLAGQHGGSVVGNETHRFEVMLNPDADKIEVFTLAGPKKKMPKKMSITLFRDNGTGQTVELKAVSLKEPMPKYQGELSLGAGSYVGAELRFEVSLKGFTALKFVPKLPNRNGKF